MAEPSIYTVGGTVQANDQGLYIPRRADEELLTLCRDAAFAYVLTPRQLGKSSLMIRTAEQLIEEGIQSVIIDLPLIGTQITPEQWYKGLLVTIADQLMLTTSVEQWWQARDGIGVTQRLTQFFEQVLLTEIPDRVVIFVDEIDTTLKLDFTDDFYAAIRSLYVARARNSEFHRLSFVLIGNRWVATAGWDSTARLWDLTSSNPSASTKIIKFDPDERVVRVAFSQDGRWLAAGSWNYQVQLQDMNNLAKESVLLKGHGGRVLGLEFSPDNQWLATSSEDHTIRLWNPMDITAAPIVLRGHKASVGSLAFSSDSRWILSGSNDVRLWQIGVDNLITVACRTAGRNLTQQEWQQAFGNEPYRKTCPI
ncbi:hypothetical protein WA1_28220 [Scytonema hofmannii PCC 7110]|uniref:Uncharacterized protein n=1 Tax=Scytonema hofmannii PCC 7110 TaxID=128403 RepID=A0A139X592_9CYAN|nr:AAA-like domain-containing protein [Scytonema hofmannii]KYC39858.1 hypothetical protein WA1_28220 [Scytonema hofmannii PCC 7110]